MGYAESGFLPRKKPLALESLTDYLNQTAADLLHLLKPPVKTVFILIM
jgi:hypothetical protein